MNASVDNAGKSVSVVKHSRLGALFRRLIEPGKVLQRPDLDRSSFGSPFFGDLLSLLASAGSTCSAEVRLGSLFFGDSLNPTHKAFQNGCTVVPSPYLFYSSLCVHSNSESGIVVNPNGKVKWGRLGI